MTADSVAPNYLTPELPSEWTPHAVPVVTADASTLGNLGRLVDSPDELAIEIVRWPAQGWRPVDPDSGDEGGVKEGQFECEWKGDVLYGTNHAVGGQYVLGYGVTPDSAETSHQRDPKKLLIWHANYHPDGGQLFMPDDDQPYLVPLAAPGDDVRPEDFTAFRVTGGRGLYVPPNVWHEGVFPYRGRQSFFDRQGAVHARVSVDFAREFGCLLEMPLS